MSGLSISRDYKFTSVELADALAGFVVPADAVIRFDVHTDLEVSVWCEIKDPSTAWGTNTLDLPEEVQDRLIEAKEESLVQQALKDDEDPGYYYTPWGGH